MRITRVFAHAALCCALTFAGASAFAQEFSKEQLQQTYLQYLGAEGYKPSVTESGNILFRREGKSYIIFVNEKDPEYFQMWLAFKADDTSPEGRRKDIESANTANAETKVVKVYLDSEGDPTFSAEMLLVVPGDFKIHFSRLLRAIDYARDKFQDKRDELK